MLRFVVRRTLLAFFTVWVISMIAFVTIQLPPGDYADIYVSSFTSADAPAWVAEMKENIRREYGLDQPVFVQYGKWVFKILRGDFGNSYAYNQPVGDVIQERLLMTIILVLATALFAWSLSIPIGIYTAVRQHSVGDYTVTFFGFLGLAVPDFLLALWLLWIAFVYFPDHSIGGLFSPEYMEAPWSFARVIDLLKHMWIPVIVIGTAGTAGLIRVMRANVLDELHKPYVVTARSKGLAEWKLILKYPVRLALNPLVSTVGYLLPALMSGSVIVSVVLNLPTEGQLLLQAILNEDLILSATIVLLLGTFTVIGTLISDILLGMLDPRIRVH